MNRIEQLEQALRPFTEEAIDYEDDYGDGGGCYWCHGRDYHEDDCPTQVARQLLGMPLLKTKAEWEAEEAVRKEANQK
jgi:uncharacterized protein (DUF1786 family)